MAGALSPAKNDLVQDLKDIFVATLALFDNTFIKSSLKLPAAEVDWGFSLETFRNKLKLLAERSLAYAESVEDLCWFGRDEDRIKRIKERIICGDCRELTDFVEQLNVFLVRSQEAYGSVEAAFEDVFSSAQKAALTCREKGREKKDLADKTLKALAGVATGAAAGGVAASVAAGIFTFGVGTIVGLSLTAAGTAVASAGLAVSAGHEMHKTASHFFELESMFTELSQSCKKVMQCASHIHDSISCLKVHLESISAKIGSARQSKASLEEHSSLIVALDHLSQRFDGFDCRHISTLRKELEKKLTNAPKHTS